MDEEALREAEDLMAQASRSSDVERRIELAHDALDLSPDCAEAYVLLAEEAAESAEEAADLFEEGVNAGRTALGDGFDALVGRFWEESRSRALLRALYGLALRRWELGELDVAAGHLEELLRLNPRDHLGGRFQLATLLLEKGDAEALGGLLARYPRERSADWLYARAAHAFLAVGDTPDSRAAAQAAFQANPFVPPFLTGAKRLPRELPDEPVSGEPSEAMAYAADARQAWRAQPEALSWLDAQLREFQAKR